MYIQLLIVLLTIFGQSVRSAELVLNSCNYYSSVIATYQVTEGCVKSAEYGGSYKASAVPGGSWRVDTYDGDVCQGNATSIVSGTIGACNGLSETFVVFSVSQGKHYTICDTDSQCEYSNDYICRIVVEGAQCKEFTFGPVSISGGTVTVYNGISDCEAGRNPIITMPATEGSCSLDYSYNGKYTNTVDSKPVLKMQQCTECGSCDGPSAYFNLSADCVATTWGSYIGVPAYHTADTVSLFTDTSCRIQPQGVQDSAVFLGCLSPRNRSMKIEYTSIDHFSEYSFSDCDLNCTKCVDIEFEFETSYDCTNTMVKDIPYYISYNRGTLSIYSSKLLCMAGVLPLAEATPANGTAVCVPMKTIHAEHVEHHEITTAPDTTMAPEKTTTEPTAPGESTATAETETSHAAGKTTIIIVVSVVVGVVVLGGAIGGFLFLRRRNSARRYDDTSGMNDILTGTQ